MTHRKKWTGIILINILILAGAALFTLNSLRHLPRYSYSIEDWVSDNAVYQENGIAPGEALRGIEEPAAFLWGPYKPLQKGSYTANIEYSAEEDQSCIATASGNRAGLFDSSEGLLSKHLDRLSYQFEVKDDVPEFQLVFKYNGSGDFAVRSVSLTANNLRQKRFLTEAVFFVLLADEVILFLEKDRRQKKVILALAGITALVTLPLAVRGIHNGFDLGVHYLRIEAILQALRSGQFPARISSITLFGLGYPFSIYYNDLFLYFPAVLRLLGFSVNTAYKIYLFSVSLLTVILSYFSFKNIFRSFGSVPEKSEPGQLSKNEKTALILTLLYSTASYRLLNVWVRGAVGEYTAQAFLPLLALAVYRTYFAENETFRRWFGCSVLLAAAMSGLIGSHILTTMMTGFLLLLVCLVLWKRTFRKQTLLTLFTAAVLTVLLNLYFLVPFFDYYLNIPTQIRDTVDNGLLLIQSEGLYPAQFFNVFQSVTGNPAAEIGARMQMTPGLVLMLTLVGGIVFRLQRKWKKLYDIPLIFSLFLLFLSSDLFPWDWLAIHFPPWRLLTQVQSPCRFLVPAILFLTLLAGCLLRYFEQAYLQRGLVILSVLMTFWFMGSLFENSRIINIYDTSGVRPDWISHNEYMIRGSSRDNIDTRVIGTNIAAAEILSRTSDTLKIYCRSGEEAGEHLVDSPVYNYPGYHVTDMEGNEYPFYSGDENRIYFSLPDGFDGTVTIAFVDPGAWRTALWISFFSVIFLSAWFFIGHKN